MGEQPPAGRAAGVPPAVAPPPAEPRATLAGAAAVGLWGALALLTAWTGDVPPFQLVAMTFAIAWAVGMAFWWRRDGAPWRHARQPWRVWALGAGGLFGYHFFYFTALDNAPAAEASLIAYLWPLLIVLFSALLPGERLRWVHPAGAGLGLLGCALLVTDGGRLAGFRPEHAPGYMAALACALTWSSYSVLSRRFGEVSTGAVAWFCAAAALLGLACHLMWEETVWPATAGQWAAVAGLGLGPVGAAFFLWDAGVKRGDIRALGALSYGAPLLSAGLLALFGVATATWTLAAACGLIAGGAALATRPARKAGRGLGRRES